MSGIWQKNKIMKTIKDLTEYSIKFLGFELVKEFAHDQFFTNRYKKGKITVDFTYDGPELISIDATIDEVVMLPINKKELQSLDKILNKAQNKSSK